MIVAEVIQTLLELDQKSEILFIANLHDTPFIYVVANLPNGKRVAAELPTATLKSQEKTIE